MSASESDYQDLQPVDYDGNPVRYLLEVKYDEYEMFPDGLAASSFPEKEMEEMHKYVAQWDNCEYRIWDSVDKVFRYYEYEPFEAKDD